MEIPRDLYLTKLKNKKNNKLIKIITGLRRPYYKSRFRLYWKYRFNKRWLKVIWIYYEKN